MWPCHRGYPDHTAVTNSPKSPWLKTVTYPYGSRLTVRCVHWACVVLAWLRSDGQAGVTRRFVHDGFPPVWVPGLEQLGWEVALSLSGASSCGLGFLTAWRFQETKCRGCWSPETRNQTRTQRHFACVLWSEQSQSQPSFKGGMPAPFPESGPCTLYGLLTSFNPSGVLGNSC